MWFVVVYFNTCYPCCPAVCRFMIPGMGGRDDWGRTEDELMRARGVVDEVLVCMGLAPAHYDENLRARVRPGWLPAAVCNS
jgi:hypothetical protein